MAEGGEERNVNFQLTVLHNDDPESQLIDAGPGLEDFGGVARFATLAGKLKTDALRGPGIRSKRGVILLTAGDNIFAGAQSNASLAKGIPFYEAIAMETIGYSVSGLDCGYQFSGHRGRSIFFSRDAIRELGISYQQALFNYIVNSLGGFISAADYPERSPGARR